MKSEPGLSTIWISAAEGTLFSAARCAAVGGAPAGRSGADCWALPRGTAARAATPAAVLRNPRRPACFFCDLPIMNGSFRLADRESAPHMSGDHPLWQVERYLRPLR